MRTLPSFLCILLLAACSPSNSPSPRSETHVFAGCPGQPASYPPAELPAIKLGCMDGSGQLYNFSRNSGKPQVITLWASWCAPCRDELPAFQRLWSIAGKDISVIGVNSEDEAGRAFRFAEEIHMTFPQVYDPVGKMRRALGRTSIPITIFVDQAGHVRHTYSGEPVDDAQLQQLVETYLGYSF